MLRVDGSRRAWLLCVILAGCSTTPEAKDASLTKTKPAPPAPTVYDATLSRTYDDAAVAYLGVERKDLKPEELTSFDALEVEQRGSILPLDSPAIPERLRGEQRFTLLTEAGPLPIGPSRGVLMHRGASEDHLIHTFEVPPQLGASEEAPLLVAVPLNDKLSPAARTRPGERVDAASPVGVKVVEIVRGLIEAQREALASAPEPTSLEVATLDPGAHIQIVRGRFGAGKALLVAYAVPRSQDPEASSSEGHLSGLFLLNEDATGLLHVVEGSTFEAAEVRFLVDVEGDGVDEARFDMSYYEGSYEHLMYVRDGQAHILTIAGDGA